ncbi:hypothetical protein Kpol_1002p92 [Vanderwaltozyma polyspora DSM 70294]|uniref:Uncharacterized protein n=1 Tax=Vanderwaltozyma polyspora (strain ATCC 22028 / DSM 70294 / BCRC 21397 / CBS 2163 / NBRC 10782 / NRRL Y-8283 / UCD 57-17) TaxID=436907 RepID=A7TEC2_VANPO|nr:uncharacterized protein Kpol_1002p92 [Vanderwaltozyma polyspora DSM 70294]EDO19444.1 hypothetical protein Kpol_1002p92 [Vanderwaltozyma polyspora DSM 70294]
MGLCASTHEEPVSSQPKPVVKTKSTPKSKNVPQRQANADLNKRKQKKKQNDTTDFKISEQSDENRTKLTPQEAAKLAAEKRLAESNEKDTKGALGKKLATERAKSHKSQMVEQVEKQKIEKANEDLVYD